MISAMVVNRDGTIAGFQDNKVQKWNLSEDGSARSGPAEALFPAGPLLACVRHKASRYPETVRLGRTARRTLIVFHLALARSRARQ